MENKKSKQQRGELCRHTIPSVLGSIVKLNSLIDFIGRAALSNVRNSNIITREQEAILVPISLETNEGFQSGK